jgi:hypothetical protein
MRERRLSRTLSRRHEELRRDRQISARGDRLVDNRCYFIDVFIAARSAESCILGHVLHHRQKRAGSVRARDNLNRPFLKPRISSETV